MPSEEEIEVENNWIEAEGTLSAFYNYLNLHDFEKARKQLSDDFAKKESNYSIASLTEWALKKQTDTKIKNLVREPGLSKKTTKVFSYETQYDLADGGKNCGEKLTAYIVLRDEKWTIDTIHPNGYIKCEYWLKPNTCLT